MTELINPSPVIFSRKDVPVRKVRRLLFYAQMHLHTVVAGHNDTMRRSEHQELKTSETPSTSSKFLRCSATVKGPPPSPSPASLSSSSRASPALPALQRSRGLPVTCSQHIRDIKDPEHPYSLEQLNVVSEDHITVADDASRIRQVPPHHCFELPDSPLSETACVSLPSATSGILFWPVHHHGFGLCQLRRRRQRDRLCTICLRSAVAVNRCAYRPVAVGLFGTSEFSLTLLHQVLYALLQNFPTYGRHHGRCRQHDIAGTPSSPPRHASLLRAQGGVHADRAALQHGDAHRPVHPREAAARAAVALQGVICKRSSHDACSAAPSCTDIGCSIDYHS